MNRIKEMIRIFLQRGKERKRKILATEDTDILFLQREKEMEVKMEKGL